MRPMVAIALCLISLWAGYQIGATTTDRDLAARVIHLRTQIDDLQKVIDSELEACNTDLARAVARGR